MRFVFAGDHPPLTLSSGEAAYRRARIGIVGGSKKNGRALGQFPLDVEIGLP